MHEVIAFQKIVKNMLIYSNIPSMSEGGLKHKKHLINFSSTNMSTLFLSQILFFLPPSDDDKREKAFKRKREEKKFVKLLTLRSIFHNQRVIFLKEKNTETTYKV